MADWCGMVYVPVDATKSLFSLSQVIQSVAITMMTIEVMSIEPSQKTPIRILVSRQTCNRMEETAARGEIVLTLTKHANVLAGHAEPIQDKGRPVASCLSQSGRISGHQARCRKPRLSSNCKQNIDQGPTYGSIGYLPLQVHGFSYRFYHRKMMNLRQ